MSVSILVAENDALLQSLLVEILGREEGFEIVGSVGTIPEALEAVAQLRPQVLLLDLDLMGAAGVKVLATLGALPEAPCVLALSGDENEDTQLEAIKNGVCGFLPK